MTKTRSTAPRFGHLSTFAEALATEVQAFPHSSAAARQLQDLAKRIEQHTKTWLSATGENAGTLALFAGPSGTGKTVAAKMIAKRFALPLYRIDLGKLASKYIGETEKNLSKLLDAASKEASVLFFDEADALFGKRSEVKDSHDSYANMEVSYLLQRLEQHPGVAILTTNQPKSIDSSLLRRFEYVIDFEASRDHDKNG